MFLKIKYNLLDKAQKVKHSQKEDPDYAMALKQYFPVFGH